jgi:hypothetical protein
MPPTASAATTNVRGVDVEREGRTNGSHTRMLSPSAIAEPGSASCRMTIVGHGWIRVKRVGRSAIRSGVVEQGSTVAACAVPVHPRSRQSRPNSRRSRSASKDFRPAPLVMASKELSSATRSSRRVGSAAASRGVRPERAFHAATALAPFSGSRFLRSGVAAGRYPTQNVGSPRPTDVGGAVGWDCRAAATIRSRFRWCAPRQ